MKRWKKVGERELMDLRIFKLKEVALERDGGRRPRPFYVFDSPDWVNIIPLTGKRKVVLISQYRAGIDDLSLEIPGGMVGTGEAPAAAAARELTEETGYVAGDLVPLGSVEPNPAILNNRCYFFLARNCEQTSETKFDPDEDIELVPTPLENIPRMISEGKIRHALVVAAFHHLFSKGPDVLGWSPEKLESD